jgi:hypothetical protein
MLLSVEGILLEIWRCPQLPCYSLDGLYPSFNAISPAIGVLGHVGGVVLMCHTHSVRASMPSLQLLRISRGLVFFAGCISHTSCCDSGCSHCDFMSWN